MPITFESILGTNTMINVYLICLGVSSGIEWLSFLI